MSNTVNSSKLGLELLINLNEKVRLWIEKMKSKRSN